MEFVFDSSEFRCFRGANSFFYDFTRFIIEIDKKFSAGIQTLMLYRNRRMGKSLLLSVLNYYYNIHYADLYDELFFALDICHYQSKLMSAMHVLELDLSSISVENYEIFNSELNKLINACVKSFIKTSNINEDIIDVDCCLTLFNLNEDMKRRGWKILVLIDEYDSAVTKFFGHFSEIDKFKYKSNENIQFMNYFRKIFVRLKNLVTKNLNFYLFITGVSPQALNDFTSGFNIGFSLGESRKFADILGYPESHIEKGLDLINIPQAFKASVLKRLRDENNGYKYYYDEYEVPTVYNPSKINYSLLKLKENMDFFLENDIKINEDELFVKKIFNFQENINVKPAESVLSTILDVPNIHNILIKFINYENNVGIKEKISGPKLSYWNFNDENQVLSYLFYLGALTYATYEDSNQFECFLKIPNSIAQEEYLDAIKNRLENNENINLQIAIQEFFENEHISSLLKPIQQFLKCNTQAADINNSREDGLDWCIFSLLKPYLKNQIQRQPPFEEKQTKKIFYGDLIIKPANANTIYLIEEKNIPYLSLRNSLKNKYGNIFLDINFDSRDWNELSQAYKRIFLDESLFPPLNESLENLEIESSNLIPKIKYKDYLQNAKIQIEKYETLLKKKPEYFNFKIKKYIVIRIGPSKLFGYDIK